MPGSSSTLTELSDSFLRQQGNNAGYSSPGNFKKRNVYPAIVIRDEDPANQHRIFARIVSLDNEGNIQGGRDRDIPDDNLPFCLPFESQILHIKPLKNEMVFVILENPEDQTSLRYWKGPIITNKKKLSFQDYKDSRRIYQKTDFFPDNPEKGNPQALAQFPDKGDVALQGRKDADLMLKPREFFAVAGKFQKESFQRNDISPSFIQLKQFDGPISEDVSEENALDQFSQLNMQSTNINIFSPRGKFRDEELADVENNEDLLNFGVNALKLHPLVFGDELVLLLDLMRRVLLNHIHTPHQPALNTPEIEELKEYTLDGRLQKLISNHIRTN